MKRLISVAALVLAFVLPLAAQTLTSHTALQAVDANGNSLWSGGYPIRVRGILLNAPEEMMDIQTGAVSEGGGGRFQVFFQAVGDDTGGTALYMAQNNYGAGGNYSTAEWEAELSRVMVDVNGRRFRPGDLIEVTANWAIPYNGKVNINEGHSTNALLDFNVALVQANVGLPQPVALTIPDLVDTNNVPVFDPTRQTGGERWQGMRVRLDGIRLADTNGWNPDAAFSSRRCVVTNAEGLSFFIRLPRTDLGDPPVGWFSAVGILNQEGSNSNTNGYELFVQDIGPELGISHNRAGKTLMSFSGDYEGFVLEHSDDGGQTWREADAMPVKVIALEDMDAPDYRFYRLIRKVDE